MNRPNLTTRVLEPEWLDDMSPSDPKTRRVRNEVARINRVMGNCNTLFETLQQSFPYSGPIQLADLGAGDASFTLALARKLARDWRNVTVCLVDRQLTVSDATKFRFRRLGWQVREAHCDVFDWLSHARNFDAIIANLFLHHFKDEELSRLLEMAATATQVFVACEPLRTLGSYLASRCVGLLGCGAVTRHDAIVSVKAGFRDQELARLWPQTGWLWREWEPALFSHAFAARRFRT